MMSQRHMHLEVEMLKWLAVLALASALALVMASQAFGGERGFGDEVGATRSIPGLLPSDMERLAEPMRDVAIPADLDGSEPNEGEFAAGEDFLSQWNTRLWTVLDLHRQGQVEQAIEAWSDMPLPCESEVWRFLALGAAYLQCGQLDDAVAMLDAAEGLEPDNPVLHYYVGILRMQQAATTPQWYDATGETPARFVAWVPRKIAPNSKSMVELAAMTAFQRAIDTSVYLEQNRLLIGSDVDGYQESSMSQMPPMVYDLLVAIGADNFEGKSHNMMSYLCLDRGWLDQAEQHMDRAAETGLAIPYGYGDLGERYELDGRPADAARSYLKQMAQGGPVVAPAQKFYDNLRKALIDMF